MLPSFLLSLREGLEAALVLGITLSLLHRINRRQLIPYVWRGAMFAVILSLLSAILLQAVGASFEGAAEQIFEGLTMLSAAILLTWMIFWMQRQSVSLKQGLEQEALNASISGGRALFFLAFFAVGREGLELALFLTAASANTAALQMITGVAAGLAVSFLLGFILFKTTHRLNLRRFFLVTNILLILFAAGLVAHGVHELNEAGIVPPLVEHLWDINPILDEKSPLGVTLTALIGYNANPSLTEVLAYGGYFLLLGFLTLRKTSSQRAFSSQGNRIIKF
jgi:high-affinity iron transporter